MRDNPAFSRFVTRRSDLLMRFDALRSQIDDWIEKKAEAPGLSDLALLQGLLLTRAQVLAELVANDEPIMDQLFAERTDEASIQGQAAAIRLGNPQPKEAAPDRTSMPSEDRAIEADMLAIPGKEKAFRVPRQRTRH